MTRIRVTGGPWPERIGLEGRIVTDELDPDVYPRNGLGKWEHIILLDDDPYDHMTRGLFSGELSTERGWSCTIDRESVEVIE